MCIYYRFLTVLFLVVLSIVSNNSGLRAENILVREDRIWNYEKAYYTVASDDGVITELSGYHFKGSRSFDGQTYNIFRDAEGKEVAYLREEDGRIYRYNDDTFRVDYEEKEYLLYDFNAGKGDVFSCLGLDNYGGYQGCMFDVLVDDITEYTYGGTIFNCQHLHVLDPHLNLNGRDEDPWVVEGVGSVRGLLMAPQFGVQTLGMRWTYYYIRTMTTLDGKILFESDYWKTGVEEIESGDKDFCSPSDRIYDLQGRELTVPVNGQPYIRGGKVMVETRR